MGAYRLQAFYAIFSQVESKEEQSAVFRLTQWQELFVTVLAGLIARIETVEISLSDKDWDRIIFALSHFSHNADFHETMKNVLHALGRPSEPD